MVLTPCQTVLKWHLFLPIYTVEIFGRLHNASITSAISLLYQIQYLLTTDILSIRFVTMPGSNLHLFCANTNFSQSKTRIFVSGSRIFGKSSRIITPIKWIFSNANRTFYPVPRTVSSGHLTSKVRVRLKKIRKHYPRL